MTKLTSPLLLVAIVACSGGSKATIPIAPQSIYRAHAHKAALTTPITNVIVLVQENRTVDNLFQGLAGANTQKWGIDSHGHQVLLVKRPLGSRIGCLHSYTGFVQETDGGKNDHFDLQTCDNSTGVREPAYSYVDPATIPQYLQLASTYAFADETHQSNEGPSLPAHLYLIGATSNQPGTTLNIAQNDGSTTSGPPIGCDAPPTKTVGAIDMSKAYPGSIANTIFPCIRSNTIFNELDAAGISWKYYTPSTTSIWTAPYAISSLYQNDRSKVTVPETTVLSDIVKGALPQVSYVIPSAFNSDHPGGNSNNSGGPTWVASIYNAVCASPYWSTTAIIVVWDDWGGWYDHVTFTHPASSPTDPFEYGLRVPLIAISPYALPAYVDHTQRDFSAVVHFIEDVYGLSTLGNLNTLDAQTDDLFSMFNFTQTPHPCTQISTPGVTVDGLIHRPPDTLPVDTE